MNDKKVILQTILGQGILPLFYAESPSVCVKTIQTLYRAGVRAVEYTNRGTAALDNFTMLKKTFAAEAPDLYLGIGTVKSAAEARAFIKAGADFIVAPIVSPEVAAIAAEGGLLWVPGCMTPTEIYRAQELKAAPAAAAAAAAAGPVGSTPYTLLRRAEWPCGRVPLPLHPDCPEVLCTTRHAQGFARVYVMDYSLAPAAWRVTAVERVPYADVGVCRTWLSPCATASY